MIDKPKPYGVRLTVEHSCLPNGDIVSRTLRHDPCESTVDVVSRHVVSTRDAAVRKSLIALGWTPPPEPAPAPRTGRPLEPMPEARDPMAYPLAYRLVTVADGDGNDVIKLEGLHIINNQRQWVGLPTQASAWSEDSIPSFLPL